MPEKGSLTVVESSERLEGVIQSAIDAIVIVDEQQHILVFNPAAERMFRCQEQEAVGTRLERFVPQRFRAEHGAVFERARQNDVDPISSTPD